MYEIVDHSGTGEITDLQGRLIVLTDQDALVNSINLWACSFKGEKLYHPHAGGVLTRYLFQPMSDDKIEDMRNDLISGLANFFNPSVNVNECNITPDYERNIYWIEIKGNCPSLKVSIYNYIGIKSQV